MTKRYTTVNGQILFVENVESPGKSMALVPDTLGNVIANKDVNGDMVRTCEYWPYGEIRTETSGNPTPFGYGGTWGYYSDPSGMLYVRARYYKPVEGRWLTVVDPAELLMGESPFGYAFGSPTTINDPSGLSPGGDLHNCIERWTNDGHGHSARSACLRCKARLGYKGGFDCNSLSDQGIAVPPWTKPPIVSIPPVVCTLEDGYPFGHLLEPGDAACEYFCMRSRPKGINESAQKKWCKSFCTKIRQGGCRLLNQLCDTLCGSGQEFNCKSCLAFFDIAGCPAELIK